MSFVNNLFVNNNAVVVGDLDVTGTATASSFSSTGGTSSQFVKGNGSLDSTVYVANPSVVDIVITGAGLITNSIKNDDDAFTINLTTASIHNGTGNVLFVDSTIEAYTFNKTGGTKIQYLMADGSTLTQSATSGNSNFYLYDNTNSTTDITPVSGEVIINSISNNTASIVYISHVTRDNIDVEVFWKFVNTLTELYLQDQSLSTNYIQYNITAPPTITVGNKLAIPVAVVNSAGTGATSFGAGHNILVSFFTNNLEVDTRLSTLETKTVNQSSLGSTTLFNGQTVIREASGVVIPHSLIINCDSTQGPRIIASDNAFVNPKPLELSCSDFNLNCSGYNNIRCAAGQNIALIGNVNNTGYTITSNALITTTSTLTPIVDTATAGTLSIGNTKATDITLGKTGITTTIPGNLTVTGTTGLIQGFNIPALDTRMSNVETKTQNQISIANSTTFSGNINFDTINTIITNLPTLSSNTAPTGYIASASTTGSFQPWLIFDNNNGTNWDSSNSVYNSVTGIYSGAVSTTVIDLGAILGEWFQIQTPNNITVTSYTYRSSGVSNGMNTFYLVYSSNGTTWNVADLRKSINYVSSDLSFTLVTPRTAKYWRYIVTVVGNTAETTLRTKCEVSKINFTLMSNPIVGVVSSDKTSFTSTQLVTKSYVDKLSNTAFNGYLPSTSINNIMDQPWKPIKRTYITRNMIWISAPINKFISVGGIGDAPVYSRISYSSDGINWTDVSGLSGNYLLRSIAWSPNNGGLIVAIGDSGSQYATSTNGIDWTLRPQIVANTHISSIVYATTLGLFVAVSSSDTPTTNLVVITSSDGINWITRTIETTTRYSAICWCPELSKLYIGCHAYGTPGVKIFSSLDGINWSLEAFISNCLINPCKIIYANNLGLFVMVGYNDYSITTLPSIMTSPNGTDWTYRATTDSSQTNSWADVVWSPELNILIAITDTTNNKVDTMYSLDGITWKSFNSNNLYGGYAICWSKELGKFMYCANNYIYSLSPNGYVDTELNNIEKKNNSIYSSIGGVGFKDSWLSSTGGTSSLITGIASNGTNVVLATSSGIKYSTNNGVSWVDVASSIANAGVIWFSSQILFIAKNATQYQTSTNGISWTAAAATNAGGSFGKNNQQVSFKNMLISSNATVGSYIQTNTNSSTYTVRTAARPVSSMVLAKANIMTFGVSGCMISTDGITWTNDTLVTNIKASCYSETLNTIFAIPDGTSTLLKSKDSGVTWITLLNVFPVSIAPQFIIWDDNIGLGFVFLETNNSTTVMTMYQFDKNGNVVGGSLVEQGLSSAISGGPNDGIYIPSLSRFIIARNSSLQPVYNVISNSIVSSGNITSYGTLKSSTSTLTPVVDTATAVALSIGNTNATSITLGKTGIITTIPGTLTASSLIKTGGTSTQYLMADGSTLNNPESYVLNMGATSFTKVKKSINFDNSTINIIKTRDIIATLDNETNQEQKFTFGESIPNRWVAVGQGTNTLAYSSDGLTWTGIGSAIFSSNGNGVDWNGTRWVAVGNGTVNTMAYSYDGINWTGLGKTIFSSQGRGVAWNGTMWVAVGNGTAHTMAYSYDGINWTGLGLDTFSGDGYGVAWNGTMWVAVGNGTAHTMAYSYDGINWTGLGKTIFSGGLGRGVAWNGTMWVAVGNGTVNNMAYSYDGINWNPLGKTIFSGDGYGVAWNGTMWVAVGNGTVNNMAYSYDGITWNPLGVNTFSAEGRGVSWNGTRWVAVGSGTNTIAYSADGITWVGRGTSIFSVNGIGVSYNNMREHTIKFPSKLTVAVGSGTNTMAYSNDGINWNPLGKPIFSGVGYDVDCNGIIWVAVGGGNNTIAYSYNGINWTGLGLRIFSSYGYGVSWNGSMWVAVGEGTNSIAYSYDGITWTGLGLGTFSTGGYDVAWGGNMWVAVGNGTVNNMAYSYDGITWNPLGKTIFSSYGNGVSWNGIRWVAGGSGTAHTLAYSADGINWTGLGVSTFSTSGNYIAWNGTRWVAVGNGTNTIAYSNDGINWNPLGLGTFSTYGNGVSWNGTRWVAVGSGTAHTMAYSYDGITWTGLGTSIFSGGYGVSWNKNLGYVNIQQPMVSCGDGTYHTMAYSPNGINWTGLGKTIFSSQGRGVAWNGTMWVAVGNGTVHTMAYSYDGINWTGLGLGTFSSLGRGVAWNGTMWVAVGNGTVNTMAYSYDGITWNPLGKTIFSGSGNGVSWNGTKWVAVGNGTVNTMAYSVDGLTWTPLGKPIFSVDGVGVAWGGNMWVAVGSGTVNTMAYSYDGINWTGLDKTIFSVLGWGVAWNGIRWVAVGQGTNTIAYSTDGINWTGLGLSVIAGSGYSVAWNGNFWVATGWVSNTMAYSYDGITWFGLGTSIYTSAGYAVAGNSNVNATIVDSAIVLRKNNNINKIDIVSDGYYNGGWSNMTAVVKSTIL